MIEIRTYVHMYVIMYKWSDGQIYDERFW